MNAAKRGRTDASDAAEAPAGAKYVEVGQTESGKPRTKRRGLKIGGAVVVGLAVIAAGVLAVGPGVVEKQRNPVAEVALKEPSPQALELHDGLLIADMHSDALLWKRSILDRGERGHVDVPRLQEGNVALQVFASVTQSPRGQNLDGNTDETDNITPLVAAQLQPPRTWGRGWRGFTHFFDNEVAGSMHGVDRGGLTDLGREVFAEMQELGMAVDLAYASPAAMADMIELADAPLVYSHGGVRATCDANRNLTDEQIRGIADTGGVIGIGYWEDAVCGLGTGPVVDAIDHVVEVAGIDAAALGSDFDGSAEVPWDTSQLAVITQELMDRGYSDEDIAKIMGGNTLRVLREVLPE